MDQLNILEEEVAAIQNLLQKKQDELSRLKNEVCSNQNTDNIQSEPSQKTMFWADQNNLPEFEYQNGHQANIAGKDELREKSIKTFIGTLPRWAIERYSRQILLQEVGVRGQRRLCDGRVLIVGAGGLGCPAGAYLAGAGVGEIGIVDYDTVDVTNIHRQFLHMEKDQALSKAESAANSLRSINSKIKVTPYNVQLSSQNAVQIASQYDIVLDCTDNVPTRYLLNDLCVLLKVPLISGSALKMEGQLTMYGYTSKPDADEKDRYQGACYRCVFPRPPPAAAVGSCSANGVAGPVPGAIGSLQALEAIKYLIGTPYTKLLVERMMLFDGEDMTFRTVKLRPRSPQCAICSDKPTISQLIDYELFCNAQASDKTKESNLKSEIRRREKEKRMTGQSYYGFRTKPKWVQDVPKSERKMGPPCKTCRGAKKCSIFSQSLRQEIFNYFWNDLDWKRKRVYLRSLIDSVPVRKRRVKIKGIVSRKGDSKIYNLLCEGERLPVCRVMFLNTLAVKEATVRCWLVNEDRPKATKKPLKAINVDSFINGLPKLPPKCQHCLNSGSKAQYINIDNIKNLFQLYNLYSHEMKLSNCEPASRKTFSKVIQLKNIRIFKAKNGDVCDIVKEHNNLPILNYENGNDLELDILPPEHRISATELSKLLSDCEQRHLLVDVRNEAEFNMCRIDGSINCPIDTFEESVEELVEKIEKGTRVTFVCRRGNDSQLAAEKVISASARQEGVDDLKVLSGSAGNDSKVLSASAESCVKDLKGGLHAWALTVDSEFPIY